MAIWHEENNGCYVIHVDELEPSERDIDRIRQILTVAFMNQKYNLIFDLSSCQMIDSYFIGLLISTFREVKELGGAMRITGVKDEVMNVFEIIRLNQVIDICPTIEEAMSRFSTPAVETR